MLLLKWLNKLITLTNLRLSKILEKFISCSAFLKSNNTPIFSFYRAEKERQGVASELNELRSAMDQLSNEKTGQQKFGKHLEQQCGDLQAKYEQIARALGEVDQAKKKLAIENSDMQRNLEEGESNLSKLSKVKVSLATQLEDTKRMADEESRELATLLGKFSKFTCMV